MNQEHAQTSSTNQQSMDITNAGISTGVTLQVLLQKIVQFDLYMGGIRLIPQLTPFCSCLIKGWLRTMPNCYLRVTHGPLDGGTILKWDVTGV